MNQIVRLLATTSIQSCANIVTKMENLIMLSRVNYVYMASSQSKFVLSNSSIVVNLSKCEKILCFLFKNKKVSYGSSYKDK